MKRFIFSALALVTLVCAYPRDASAKWVFEKVRWHHPCMVPGTVLVSGAINGFVNDTLYIPAAAAKVDTSAEFSLLDCDPVRPFDYGRTSATGDSTPLAFIVITADSAVASSINWKDTAIALQGNFGNGAGWQTLSSGESLPTDGVKTKINPIWNSLGALTNDIPINLTSPTGSACQRARLIVTGGTSVAAPQMRIFIKKWKEGFVAPQVEFQGVSQ